MREQISSFSVPPNTGFTGLRKGYFALLQLLGNSVVCVLKYSFSSFVWLDENKFRLDRRQSDLETAARLMQYSDVQDHPVPTAVGRKVTRAPSSYPSLTLC